MSATFFAPATIAVSAARKRVVAPTAAAGPAVISSMSA